MNMNEGDIFDTTTPRALLSSLMLREEPAHTVRQPPRQAARAEMHQDEDGREKHDGASSPANPLKDDQSTPRGIISNILSKNDPVKTVRGPTQQVSRTELSSHSQQEKEVALEKTAGGNDAVTFELKKKFHVKRIRLEDINLTSLSDNSDSEIFGNDLLKRLKDFMQKQQSEQSITEENRKSHGTRSVGTETGTRQRPSVPSMDVSNMDESSTSKADECMQESSTTSQSQVSERKKAVSLTDKSVPAPHQASSMEIVPTEEAVVNTALAQNVKENMSPSGENAQQEKQSFDTIVTDSATDEGTNLGPLDLSSIAEAEVTKPASTKKQQTIEKFLKTTLRQAHETDGKAGLQDNSDLHISAHLRSQAPPFDNTTAEVNVGVRETQRTSQEIGATNRNDTLEQPDDPGQPDPKRRRPSQPDEIMDQYSPIPAKAPQRVTPLRAAAKKRVARRNTNNLPFPKSQLTGVIQHYASLKLSKEARLEMERISERYFARTAEELERVCMSNNRKTVNLSDMKTLMKRRGRITSRNTLNVLIEENLPLEYREELIPCASAGNVVYP